MERKALYNSLRIDASSHPDIQMWQKENYRKLSEEELYRRLKKFEIHLDRPHFIALADEVDTPENLHEMLVEEEKDGETSDQIYLLLFELWRRLVPEKYCLAILCDELDHQIELFDQEDFSHQDELEEVLVQLQKLLEESVDEKDNPKKLFELVARNTAHDLEPFLYDYIGTQIDEKNHDYAQELIEGFLPYVQDTKWFELLKVRTSAHDDPEESHLLLQKLIKDNQKKPDLDLNLEILAYVAQQGDRKTFESLVKATLSLVTLEEEFTDILASCEDFFHFEDHEKEEKIVQEMRQRRKAIPNESPISERDPDIQALKKLF